MKDEIPGLVSVIVPVYNVEKYIAKCVDSILNQTYMNIEVIIVNDGSSDQSDLIIKENYLKDSRVKYIVKENEGLSSARNVGIDNSSGEFICFIDSDDWIRNDYIEVLYNRAIRDCSDIVICNMQYIYEDGSVKKRTPHIDLDECVDRKTAMREELMGEKYKFHAQNKFIRSKLFRNYGIRFPHGRLYEDVFTTYKLICNANRVSLSKEYLYFYLQNRPGSILNTRFSEKRFDIYEAMDNIINDDNIITMNLENELQRFYIINVISLVNYIYPIYEKIDKLTRKQYCIKIKSDKNSNLLNNYWKNPYLGTVNKFRLLLLTHSLRGYCILMRIIKRNGHG